MTDPRSEDSYDVKFLVGQEKRAINAHKFILAAHSLVFHRMFCSNFRSETEVTITDIDATAFEIMINSLYGKRPILSAENIAEVYYAAEKYEFLLLLDICKSFIVNSIDSTNALALLNTYHRYNESEINEKCLSLILDDPLLFFEKPEFLEASVDVLRSILEPRNINCSLQDIEEAFLKWSEKQPLDAIDTTKWMEAVEDQLGIPKDKLDEKIKREYLFRYFEYSSTKEKHMTTSFDLTNERHICLYGIGLVLGKISKEDVNINIVKDGSTLANFRLKVKKSGSHSVNSIQDVFFKKKTIPCRVDNKLSITINFQPVIPKYNFNQRIPDVFRPCVELNNSKSFVAYLIISKID
jgi:BTB/POZ domain-containing protein 3/6